MNGGRVDYHAARISLTNKTILTEDGTISALTLGLTISRAIIGGSTSPTTTSSRCAFSSKSRCYAFAHLFEVKSGHTVRRG